MGTCHARTVELCECGPKICKVLLRLCTVVGDLAARWLLLSLLAAPCYGLQTAASLPGGPGCYASACTDSARAPAQALHVPSAGRTRQHTCGSARESGRRCMLHVEPQGPSREVRGLLTHKVLYLPKVPLPHSWTRSSPRLAICPQDDVKAAKHPPHEYTEQGTGAEMPLRARRPATPMSPICWEHD